MRKTLKRLLATLMVSALAVTSLGVNERLIDADVEATVDIVNGGDQNVKDMLVGTTATIDGVEYNNYLRYKSVTVEDIDPVQNPYYINDGDIGTRWESRGGIDVRDLDIDLRNTYKIKAIGMFWETASAKRYTIQGSLDGVNYTDIKQVESNFQKRTDMIKFEQEQNVRFLRLHCTARTTEWAYSVYEMAVWGTEAQKSVLDPPKFFDNVKVTSYAKYTGKYMVYFDEGDDAIKYNLYIDNAKSPIKSVSKSGEYLTNEDLASFEDGQHTLGVTCVKKVDGVETESEMLTAKFTKEPNQANYTDMPQIYIEGKNISNDYHTNSDFKITVVDSASGTDGMGYTGDNGTVKDSDVIKRYKDIYDGTCNMKVRGNTTAGQPKKGYNIKFSSKVSLFGMDKGKKWNLLANAMDKSLMRDFLSYNFALENGVTYSSQSRYVELYVAGKYLGNYQLTEPVEAKKGRVDINAYSTASNDILLEFGTRNEAGVDHFTTDTLGVTFDVNDPEKGDDLTDQQVDEKIARTKTFLNEFENALKTHNYDTFATYMDVDSFVDFYVVNELFKNQDFNFSSTRFYIKGDKVYAGPIWDLDLSSGNLKSSYYQDYYVNGDSTKGYKCKSMKWYNELFKNQEFINLVKARYEELQYRIQSLYRNDSTETLSINYVVARYGKSFARNYDSEENLGAGWPIHYDDGYSYAWESNWQTWMDPIDFLRDWLERRNIWLCSEYGIDMEAAYVASKPEETTETPTDPTTTQAPTTTQEPTTQAPTTTQELTTQAPTTTQEPTTQAPTTTQEPTTQAPTTTEVTTQVQTSAPTEHVVRPDSPTGIAMQGDSVIVWEQSNAASFNIYVNGQLIANTIEPAFDIQKNIDKFNLGESNEIKIVAVDAGGVESLPVTIEMKINAEQTTAKTVESTTTSNAVSDVSVEKVVVKSAKKKKSSKKLTITIKKVSNATGYQVAVFKTNKDAKKLKKALFKKFIKKNSAKLVVSHKKLKNKKKVFVRVRAYAKASTTVYGDWSSTKKSKL